MRLRLAACVSLGLVAFAACGNDYESSDSNPSHDGGTSSDASSSSSSGSSGTPGVDSGSGPLKEDENRPCEGRTPNEAFSVFVAANGNDTPTCGTREAPCKTVQTGIAKAYATAKPKVVVGPGTYAEALVLDGGLTIEGAWDVSGSTWTPSCGADHSSLATIQAPDSANTSVKATKGASVLRFLTIKSKPVAAPGESLYGLIVLGPNVKVALADTSVIVAAGGKGADGAPGEGSAAATCAAAGDGAAGANGGDGNAGSPGTLSSTEFTSGAGGDGAPGDTGHSGTAPPASAAINYDRCDASGDSSCVSGPQSTLPVPGRAGCGGGGGRGGKGGRGGGSSVGILATNAIIVTYGGSVTTGAGGVGGNGGLGAGGADGMPGQVGQTSTYLKAPTGGCGSPPDCGNVLTELAGGPAGGPGGSGGKGGQGGGGPGGWSISFAKFNGAALLASSTTVFTTGAGGKGGAPNGTDGLRQQQWP
jgi:hypothetical protein